MVARTLALPRRAPGHPHVLAGAYPLQGRFAIWGLWAGLVATVVFRSPIAGLAFLVLFVCAGILWRRDELPVLPYCIAYQWVGATAGYLYQRVAGRYPGMEVGDIEGAVLLSMLGFLALAAGFRAGLGLLRNPLHAAQRRLEARGDGYSVQRVFWTWMGLGLLMGFLLPGAPMGIWFEAAQWIYRLREFTGVFVVLLLLAILRQRRGYGYGLAAMLWSWLPALPSAGSAIASPFLLLLPVLLGQWRPWAQTSPRSRARNARATLVIGLCGVGLLLALLVWEGGLKSMWRPMVLSGAVQGSLQARVEAFLATAGQAVAEMDWGAAPAALAARASSGAGYFSYVLRRVPSELPHTEGQLTLRAVQLTLMPRILFPDKPNLGSDSWLIREYAGLPAAGFEQGTSIGLGYMAQFYIDFGAPGMFVPLFLWGLVIAAVYAVLCLCSPSRLFFFASVAALLPAFLMTYDGEIAKLMGGMLQATLVFGLLLRFVGPWLHQWLLARPRSAPSAVGARTLEPPAARVETLPMGPSEPRP